MQIATRKRNAVDEKRRLVLALTAGVTPEGQKLFMAISKTIGPQVTWQGMDICVFGDTFIAHPYRSENVRGCDDRRVQYVRKLVESQRKDVAVVTPIVDLGQDTDTGGSVPASNGGSVTVTPSIPQQPSSGGGGGVNANATNPSSNNNNSNNQSSGASAN